MCPGVNLAVPRYPVKGPNNLPTTSAPPPGTKRRRRAALLSTARRLEELCGPPISSGATIRCPRFMSNTMSAYDLRIGVVELFCGITRLCARTTGEAAAAATSSLPVLPIVIGMIFGVALDMLPRNAGEPRLSSPAPPNNSALVRFLSDRLSLRPSANCTLLNAGTLICRHQGYIAEQALGSIVI